MQHDNCGDIICLHYNKLSSLLIESNGFMSTTLQNPVKELFDRNRKEKEQSDISKEDNQQSCWCHRFNTASSHMTNSKTSDEKARTFLEYFKIVDNWLMSILPLLLEY